MKTAVIKFGLWQGQSIHCLADRNGTTCIARQRLETVNTHGTGCVLAAAVTASCALGMHDLRNAIEQAIDFTYRAIQAPSHLGQGLHPVDVRFSR